MKESHKKPSIRCLSSSTDSISSPVSASSLLISSFTSLQHLQLSTSSFQSLPHFSRNTIKNQSINQNAFQRPCYLHSPHRRLLCYPHHRTCPGNRRCREAHLRYPHWHCFVSLPDCMQSCLCMYFCFLFQLDTPRKANEFIRILWLLLLPRLSARRLAMLV